MLFSILAAMKDKNVDIASVQDPRRAHRLRAQGLWISTLEGCCGWIMVALVQNFYNPYIQALGGTSRQVALSSSIPQLMAGIAPFFAPWALAKFGRRKYFVVSTLFVQALMYIPLGLTWYFRDLWGLSHDWAVWATVACFCVSTFAGNVHSSAWQDWMGDLVPKRTRGRYFGTRNRIFATINLLAVISAGLLLQKGKALGMPLMMFSCIWGFTFFFRLASTTLMAIQYDPPHVIPPREQTLTFGQFLRNMPNEPFGRFNMFQVIANLVTFFAVPFYAVYMLRELGFTYPQYTIISIIPTIATIIMMPVWGRIIDRHGCIRPMKACMAALPILTLFWIVSDNYWWIACIGIGAGASQSGFMLCSFNYSIGILDPKKRVPSLAYSQVLGAFAMSAGAFLGGMAVTYVPTLFDHQLQTMFLISGLLRFIPAFLFKTLKEDKASPPSLTRIERFIFFEPSIPFRSSIEQLPFIRWLRR
jgi:MFS family permease